MAIRQVKTRAESICASIGCVLANVALNNDASNARPATDIRSREASPTARHASLIQRASRVPARSALSREPKSELIDAPFGGISGLFHLQRVRRMQFPERTSASINSHYRIGRPSSIPGYVSVIHRRSILSYCRCANRRPRAGNGRRTKAAGKFAGICI